jgi:hypothetical protein
LSQAKQDISAVVKTDSNNCMGDAPVITNTFIRQRQNIETIKFKKYTYLKEYNTQPLSIATSIIISILQCASVPLSSHRVYLFIKRSHFRLTECKAAGKLASPTHAL